MRTSLPSWLCGFDSRHPLQSTGGPPQGVDTLQRYLDPCSQARWEPTDQPLDGAATASASAVCPPGSRRRSGSSMVVPIAPVTPPSA